MKFCLSRIALFALLLLGVAPATAFAKPNVVIFLADDAGWGDYSQSGNRQVKTPNIDSIAKAGVSLDRFFVQPVCAPTRAEFLTGRYHPRGGVRGVSTGQERLDLDEKTVADAFQSAGYATGAFGKWHNGSQWPYHPMARGFDEYFGHTSGHWGEYFDAPLEENGRMIRTQGYIVDVCTDRALTFIEKNKDKPFLCYVPFTTPHSPWAAPARDWARFKNKPITQTATEPGREDADQTRCALAMMENQDANVGRVLAKLREHQLEENTIVLYFSDNGPNSLRWTGGMKGKKGNTDEGGVRSVCYWRWPAKLPAGHTVPQITGAIDLLPTLTALAGIPRVGNKPLDGRDLTPLLLKQQTDWPERMIFATWAASFSVRSQTHRLDNSGQLFDMVADPGQTTPINTKQPELGAQLTAALKAWRQEMFGAGGPGRSRSSGAGYPVDSRPIPVGYREFPITMLPARDGEPRGGVRRSSSAPNCSYFVNWKSPDDSMVWLLDVHTAGRYEATIDYTCPSSDAGATIELSFQDARLSGKVTPGWDPPLYPNQDTLPRPAGESPMKEFRTLKLGNIALAKGQSPLTLRALEIPGKSVMDLRRVTLTLLP
jgi:arylsulfatase A-like enzyme